MSLDARVDLRRVVVVGTSCSGKTTFAGRLAGALGIQHVELDALNWLPSWTTRPPEEFAALVEEAVAAERWVIDGNYGSVRHLTWPRATTIIWLNYPFRVVAWRALTRTLRRLITREELFSGNRESFRLSFLSRDSILWWVMKTYHRRRRNYRRLFDGSGGRIHAGSSCVGRSRRNGSSRNEPVRSGFAVSWPAGSMLGRGSRVRPRARSVRVVPGACPGTCRS